MIELPFVMIFGSGAALAGWLIGSSVQDGHRRVEAMRRQDREVLRARLHGVEARRRLRDLDRSIAQAMAEEVVRRRGRP